MCVNKILFNILNFLLIIYLSYYNMIIYISTSIYTH
nr:MAG TPA: hypothetical protein [Caudoviricetes sp.]